MIGFKIDQAKGLFFDSRAVMDATDRATRRVLAKFGSFVRQRARTSIKKRKDTSDPGNPPSSHLGLLKKWILFAYDPTRKSVVIGPARLNGRFGNAPEALEYGGQSTLIRFAHGRREQVAGTYKARPFMRPALDAELPKLPGMWQDQIT